VDFLVERPDKGAVAVINLRDLSGPFQEKPEAERHECYDS